MTLVEVKVRMSKLMMATFFRGAPLLVAHGLERLRAEPDGGTVRLVIDVQPLRTAVIFDLP